MVKLVQYSKSGRFLLQTELGSIDMHHTCDTDCAFWVTATAIQNSLDQVMLGCHLLQLPELHHPSWFLQVTLINNELQEGEDFNLVYQLFDYYLQNSSTTVVADPI
jgi:hypothetical protein